MLDTIFWIAIIIVVTYYIRTKTLWFKDFEKDYENLAKELREDAEQDRRHADSFPKHVTSQEMARESMLRFQNFIKTHDNYLHLKEKYRHDDKASHIKNDWQAYIQAIKDLQESRFDYRYLDGTNEKLLQDAYDRDYKAKIILIEIEKRFDKYLRD